MRAPMLGALVLLTATLAAAQGGVPSAEQMVEQLRMPVRTRSLRNLTVEAVPAASATPGASAEGGAAGTPAAPQGQATAPATPQSQAQAPAAPEPRPSLSLSLQFDFDSTRIRPESLPPLGNLASALASPVLAQSRFLIEGHTDARGSADYNRRLSDQRAQAVKAWLVARGVDASRLQAVGKGASELLDAQAPLAPENRRVKIINQD